MKDWLPITLALVLSASSSAFPDCSPPEQRPMPACTAATVQVPVREKTRLHGERHEGWFPCDSICANMTDAGVCTLWYCQEDLKTPHEGSEPIGE